MEFDNNGNLKPYQILPEMELQNPQYIEIISTIEMIDRANKAIEFHKQLPVKDMLAISQYTRLRANYLKQLSDLLNNFEIKIKEFENTELEMSVV